VGFDKAYSRCRRTTPQNTGDFHRFSSLTSC
jgi:hypothetical protein